MLQYKTIILIKTNDFSSSLLIDGETWYYDTVFTGITSFYKVRDDDYYNLVFDPFFTLNATIKMNINNPKETIDRFLKLLILK